MHGEKGGGSKTKVAQQTANEILGGAVIIVSGIPSQSVSAEGCRR